MPFPVAAAVGMQAVGMGMSLMGAGRSARAKRREAYLRQQVADINAGQRVAAGQQAAFEEERQARLAQSRALAVAAASGSSPSVGSDARIIAEVGAEGAYRAALQMYQGEEEARVMRLTGKLEAAALKDEASAIRFGAAADLIAGAGSMYAKYGGQGPQLAGSGTDD